MRKRHLGQRTRDRGFSVVGVDLSPAMIAIARQQVPEAEFQVASFLQFAIPPCRVVTALGEVFNYLFDVEHSPQSSKTVCQNIFEALAPGGLLIFDVAEPRLLSTTANPGPGRTPMASQFCYDLIKRM